MNPVRTRIAPSPTGSPHIGTLFQGLLNYVFAQKHQGKFIIRIEDTDRTRYVQEAEQQIFNAFAWLDITPDESPTQSGEYGPYRQSERLDIYQQHVQQLIDAGHAYYCFCSPERLDQVRKDMQKQGLPPMYDKHCRNLDSAKAAARAKTEKHVIRLAVPPDQTITFTDVIRGDISFESNTVDDQVLLKSDGFPTYHLAVVVDDHLMNISHMVRGEEWISSTPKHVLLYQYFNWQPPHFIHTPLLRNPDRSKLSKRHGHASVSWYQDQGYLKEAVINFLASRVWNHPQGKEIFSMDDLIKDFKFEAMHIQSPVADVDKLNWINGHWIRDMDEAELLDRLQPFKPDELDNTLLKQILPLIKDRLVTLSDLKSLTQFFYQAPTIDTKLLLKQSKMSPQETANYLNQVIDTVNKTPAWQAETLETACRQLQQDLQLKPRPAFMTIRVALTGQTATPPLFDVMEILGKTETTNRLQSTVKALSS